MPASQVQPQKIGAVSHQPDLYELKGGRTRISYQTTSLGGVPQLHYKDAARDLNFSGNQIDVMQTSLGSEVTVTLQLIADGPGVKFTLLVPDVTLGSKTEVKLKTAGIVVTTNGSLIGPPAGKQKQTYKIVELLGTAKLVHF